MSESCPADASASPDEVRIELERILGSQTLAGSDQLKRLLRVVVERALNGKADSLKEYNLGLEVFHRPPDYDPKVDPIVRVQARRLRAKLEEYYASEGADDALVIRIPKGAYVPAFGKQKLASPPPLSAHIPERPRRLHMGVMALAVTVALVLFAAVWMQRGRSEILADAQRGIAVLPLEMFTEDGNRRHVADQVAEVLTTELAKNKQLRVLSRTTANQYRDTHVSLPEIARSLRVRWVVEGGVGLEGTRAYIKLRCVDSQSDRKVWADVFDCELSDLVGVSARAADEMAAAVMAEIRAGDR